jgi:hypothetical protein
MTNLMMAAAAAADQRDDVSSEAHPAPPVKGDYFFLFENQIENRFAKPRREPRRKRIFRRFTRRNKEWCRGNSTRSMLVSNSPDTTALMSEDEHSLIHSHVSEFNDNDEGLSTTTSERNRRIVCPETLSLVGSSPPDKRRDGRKHKVLMKKLKSRMKKSLRDVLTKSQSMSQDAEEQAVKMHDGDDNEDDEKSTSTTVSLLDRAKRSLACVSNIPSKGMHRAKSLLHDKEEIGLYVNHDDDEVETVFQSTFDQLLIPDLKALNELRDGPPPLVETVSLDNLCGVAKLMHQGPTSLSVNYDSDFAQLELQSDDEHDPDDDLSMADDLGPALPELPASESEETEYNLFNQSSIEDDEGSVFGKYRSLLAPTSTDVSEDPSLLDDGIAALRLAWPLPQCRNQEDDIVLSGSSDDPLFVVQQSTSTEVYSVSSHRLGAAPPCAAVQEQMKQEQAADSSESVENEPRLGISCPAYATKATLEDASNVWQRIYAPPAEAPPSPTVVQKSRATWGCGLDASPVSVDSDITESEAVVPTQHNPFYNIRRYATCGMVQEREEYPFDEVDSNACAPRPAHEGGSTQTASYGCGVPDLVRSINLSHKVKNDEILGQEVLTNEEESARPRCECVKCSVTNMYANLLAKK